MDLNKLMQQAAQMQEQLMAAQDELASQEFEGTAGGGVVTAAVTGDGKLQRLQIDPSVIDPADPEMLGDLVVAAVNQATKAAHDASAAQMGDMTGGLDLGGLLGG
ncbi:MAG: YbaB/EbfC family nucleoid-associated protein [Acidimicrobiia bacterium]|nr:YbaB/EbfC family nucleoid-associated protein [Acidimicrobiia bacterium]